MNPAIPVSWFLPLSCWSFEKRAQQGCNNSGVGDSLEALSREGIAIATSGLTFAEDCSSEPPMRSIVCRNQKPGTAMVEVTSPSGL